MQTPDTVEVNTGENPGGSIIWLHGLGADGHDFEAIVPELRLPADLPLRFVVRGCPFVSQRRARAGEGPSPANRD